ncbi:hypothetical protein [Nitrobacter sp.]|uniref:hypothetical protein n=1 Tax=Nitrobacter sp. TaxID=29420 RepID=UPI0029CAB76F|nr:hypothetical protein [Nitrobacter sp.]
MAPLPPPEYYARGEIELMAEIFKRTRDPAAAWRAFFLSRKYDLELPELINAEIDRFTEAVGSIAERAHHGDATATIDPETVGKIWKGGKGRDAGSGAFRAGRSYDIAVAVARLCIGGMPVTKAIGKVAKDHATNATNVWNALKEHSYVRDMGADELGLPFDPNDSNEVGAAK